MRISREEFNQAIGAALSALRVERGFSQAEVAEGINAIPEVDRQERSTRAVAAYAALSIILRNEQGLTQEELAKRSQVPLEFVRDLEAGKDPNPDFIFSTASASVSISLLQNLRTGLKSYRMFPIECFWRTKPTKRRSNHEQSTCEDNSPRA